MHPDLGHIDYRPWSLLPRCREVQGGGPRGSGAARQHDRNGDSQARRSATRLAPSPGRRPRSAVCSSRRCAGCWPGPPRPQWPARCSASGTSGRPPRRWPPTSWRPAAAPGLPRSPPPRPGPWRRTRCCPSCGNALAAWPRRCCCTWPPTTRRRWQVPSPSRRPDGVDPAQQGCRGRDPGLGAPGAGCGGPLPWPAACQHRVASRRPARQSHCGGGCALAGGVHDSVMHARASISSESGRRSGSAR